MVMWGSLEESTIMMSTAIRQAILSRAFTEELTIMILKGKRPGTAYLDFLEIWITIQRDKPRLFN